MRKSLQDFNAAMCRKDNYPELPTELQPLNYWMADAGSCIMCIPQRFLSDARKFGYDDYELALPVKFVLAKGYTMEGGYCIVDVEYSSTLGAIVPEEYENADIGAPSSSGEAAPQFSKIGVGVVFAPMQGRPEGVIFDVDASGLLLIYNYSRPNAAEIAAMKAGQPFEIRLATVNDCIFILSKAGSNSWADSPFCTHLSKGFKDIAKPEDGLGYALTLLMTDSPSGVVKSIRRIDLGHDFSVKFFEAAMRDFINPFDGYDARLNDTMRNYTTENLVKFATARYKIK